MSRAADAPSYLTLLIFQIKQAARTRATLTLQKQYWFCRLWLSDYFSNAASKAILVFGYQPIQKIIVNIYQ